MITNYIKYFIQKNTFILILPKEKRSQRIFQKGILKKEYFKKAIRLHYQPVPPPRFTSPIFFDLSLTFREQTDDFHKKEASSNMRLTKKIPREESNNSSDSEEEEITQRGQVGHWFILTSKNNSVERAYCWLEDVKKKEGKDATVSRIHHSIGNVKKTRQNRIIYRYIFKPMFVARTTKDRICDTGWSRWNKDAINHASYIEMDSKQNIWQLDSSFDKTERIRRKTRT